MAGATVQNMNASAKEVYGESFQLVPEKTEVITTRVLGGLGVGKVGKEFVVDAQLSLDHSTTYLGDDGSLDDISDPISGAVGRASVKPSRLIFPVQIGGAVVDRFTGGDTSFEDGPKRVIDRGVRSFAKVIETMHHHGGNGIGTFTYASATPLVLTVDAAEWACAVWVGSENRPVDIYNISSGVVGTRVLSTTVEKLNTKTRALTVASSTGLVNGSTYVIFPAGAKGKEALGLFNILKRSSGSIFGLSIDDYDLWGANQEAIGSNDFDWLWFAAAVSKNSGRGVSGDNYMTLLNDIHFPKMVPNMNTAKTGAKVVSTASTFPASGAIMFGSPEAAGSINLGTDSISFRVNGCVTEIVTSHYVKQGEAAMIDLDSWMRITAARNGDVSLVNFADPDSPSQYFRRMEKRDAFLGRLQTDQALFCPEMNKNIYFSGLSTSAVVS